MRPTSDNADLSSTVKGFVHPREVLRAMPSITADSSALARIMHGNAVNLPEFTGASHVKVFADRDSLICIARRVAGSLFQPRVVLA